ncbi:MAG TPA: hypothetical protein VNY07_14970 [Chthoniobacterales bacterium]|jgi:hypothetical protein|nr:hypothetical protein [Chthoniobacterales bacterium]
MAEASLLDTFIRYGLPAILGSTVIAALVKLWQERRAARRDLIADWRENLVPLLDKPISLGEPKAKYPFMRHKSYASLRQHLKPDLVERLEAQQVLVASDGSFPSTVIIEEIGRIERKWGLP